MNQAMELWELAHTDDRFHFTFYIFSSNYGISRITFIKRWLWDQKVLRRPSLQPYQRSFSRSRLRGFFLFILCMLVQKLLILELEVWRRKGVSAHVSRCDCPLSPLRRPLDRLKGSETGPTHVCLSIKGGAPNRGCTVHQDSSANAHPSWGSPMWVEN